MRQIKKARMMNRLLFYIITDTMKLRYNLAEGYVMILLFPSLLRKKKCFPLKNKTKQLQPKVIEKYMKTVFQIRFTLANFCL